MRLQGAISPRVEARLDEMLGHPETCPHGNPIDAETARRRPAGIALSEMEAGSAATIYRITEEAEEDAGLLSYLEARALTPGAHVTILARSESLDSLTLDGPRGRATLGLRPAALVRVLPGEADPALFHRVPDPSSTAMTAPRVRIAPSPTGPLHIGTARTALFNYLYARHTGGTFVLRLEDTDQARGSIAYEKDILDGLHWLGLHWDEGPEVAGEAARGPFAPYRQMLRLPSYAAAAERLLARRHGLPLLLHARGARRRPQGAGGRQAAAALRRPLRGADRRRNERRAWPRVGRAAIRFRVGTGVVAFDDIVRGRVEIDVSNLGGDFVIVRGDGSPLYHFTVVVDDAAMEISHVIRGEDHLSNTPKHILLFRALGYPVPLFAHLPLILNPDRTKMSKRKSQTAVSDYIAEGFIREALVNYLALLGWATGTEEEVLSIDEIVERFDLDAVHKGGAVFDRERLEWLNGQWIRRLEPDDLVDRLRPFVEARPGRRPDRRRMPSDEELRSLLPMITERLPTLGVDRRPGRLPVGRRPDVRPGAARAEALGRRHDARGTRRGPRRSSPTPGAVAFEADELEPPLRALAEARGWKAGDLFMAIRVAVTGRTATPPLFDTLVALGRERTLERLDRAIAALDERSVT